MVWCLQILAVGAFYAPSYGIMGILPILPDVVLSQLVDTRRTN